MEKIHAVKTQTVPLPQHLYVPKSETPSDVAEPFEKKILRLENQN